MSRVAVEGVDGDRLHDTGPAVVKDDGGEVGSAVEGEERAGVEKVPCMITVPIPCVRARLESQTRDKRGDFRGAWGSEWGFEVEQGVGFEC